MQVNGILNKRIVLTITGNKSAMDDLTGKDLEVVIDAQGKTDQWIASISKKNLVSLHPDLDIAKMISRVAPYDMIIKQSKLVTEKIPVRVTQPIGEAPKGYQFLDVWPYLLYVTVTGPEEAVKRLKSRGLTLTFNLSDITRDDLERIQSSKKQPTDEVSFFVPRSWTKVSLPDALRCPDRNRRSSSQSAQDRLFQPGSDSSRRTHPDLGVFPSEIQRHAQPRNLFPRHQ